MVQFCGVDEFTFSNRFASRSERLFVVIAVLVFVFVFCQLFLLLWLLLLQCSNNSSQFSVILCGYTLLTQKIFWFIIYITFSGAKETNKTHGKLTNVSFVICEFVTDSNSFSCESATLNQRPRERKREKECKRIESENQWKISWSIGHWEQIGQPNMHVKFITINVYSSDTLGTFSHWAYHTCTHTNSYKHTY